MFPIHLAQLSVIPMSSLHFVLPESEYGRDDVSIAIEYCKHDFENSVHCWVWAGVGDAFIRALVDEYSVPYLEDKERLDESIIWALNSSERFRDSLPGFIASVLSLDPDADAAQS